MESFPNRSYTETTTLTAFHWKQPYVSSKPQLCIKSKQIQTNIPIVFSPILCFTFDHFTNRKSLYTTKPGKGPSISGLLKRHQHSCWWFQWLYSQYSDITGRWGPSCLHLLLQFYRLVLWTIWCAHMASPSVAGDLGSNRDCQLIYANTNTYRTCKLASIRKQAEQFN